MAEEDFESSDVLFGEGAVDRNLKQAKPLKPFRGLNTLFGRAVYRESPPCTLREARSILPQYQQEPPLSLPQ